MTGLRHHPTSAERDTGARRRPGGEVRRRPSVAESTVGRQDRRQRRLRVRVEIGVL